MEPIPSATKKIIDFIDPPMNWTVKIKEYTLNLNYLRNHAVWNRRSAPWWTFLQRPLQKPEGNSNQNAQVIQQFENNPGLVIDTISSWTLYMFLELGRHLSHKAADAVCQLVLARKSLEDYQVEYFFHGFLLTYLKRDYSWASIHLLKRAYTAWPTLFPDLFNHLVRSIAVPRQLLRDFAENSSVGKRNEMMKWMSRMPLTEEQFIHHLPTINLLFLDSEKSDQVIEFVAANLQRHSSSCYTNRHYGRLLLSLMRNTDGTNVNQRMVKLLIDNHYSEYRGPCMTLMEHIVSELLEANYHLLDQPTIYIHRSEDSLKGV